MLETIDTTRYEYDCPICGPVEGIVGFLQFYPHACAITEACETCEDYCDENCLTYEYSLKAAIIGDE